MRMFFRKLFGLKPKPVKTIPQQLSELNISDFVEITLKPSFCQNMLAQTQQRFTEQDLEVGRFCGTVVRVGTNTTLHNFFLEVQGVKKTADGVVTLIYTVLEDEIQTIKVMK